MRNVEERLTLIHVRRFNFELFDPLSESDFN